MSSRLRIVVTGLIAQHPTLGGVTWDYLQYPVGLAALGHDVYYLEDSGEWPYNLDGGPSGDDWVARDPAANVRHLSDVLARYGLGEKWAYRFPVEPRWYGMPDTQREEVLRTADLLLNVSGTIEHPDRYRQVRRLAYIDSDPGFTQVKLALGEAAFRSRVDAHDIHFSFGEKMSAAVPVTGHRWRPTRQPIVLSEWRPATARREVFTTVMSWTSYQPLVFGGAVFGQKDLEFYRFLDLPAKVAPVALEVAMSQTHHATWQRRGQDIPAHIATVLSERPEWTPSDLLGRMGWQVVDALTVSGNLDSYRDYIESSKGEWSVAKSGYVRAQAGWFSCRSACYLAAGRPVVVQDTGFPKVLPVGEGLVAFSTAEEAADAVRAIEGDYQRHAHAARALAEEWFDARKVLPRLIEDALLS